MSDDRPILQASSPHPAEVSIDVLLKACEVQRTRAGGPGGQHRNKVETAVHITHRPTGVKAQAAERRSQEANKKTALFRLRVNLALAVRVPWDRPSARWLGRVRKQSIHVNVEHEDYPAMLAQALDALAGHDMDVKKTAQRLGCTPSQLGRLLRTESRALNQVNRVRAAHSLRPLR